MVLQNQNVTCGIVMIIKGMNVNYHYKTTHNSFDIELYRYCPSFSTSNVALTYKIRAQKRRNMKQPNMILLHKFTAEQLCGGAETSGKNGVHNDSPQNVREYYKKLRLDKK